MVLGNHDICNLRYIQGEEDPQSPFRGGAHFRILFSEQLDREHYQRFRFVLMNAYMAVETEHFVVVHARLDPHQDLQHQDPMRVTGFFVDREEEATWFDDVTSGGLMRVR